MSTRKLTYSSALIALGIIFPQIFHFIDPSGQLSKFLLPLHYSAIIGGLLLGPFVGFIVGLFTPLLSHLLFSMPMQPLVYFIILEISIYGLFTGLFYKVLKINIYISILISILLGRLVLIISSYVGLNYILIDSKLPFSSILTIISFGLLGEVVYLIVIPIIVKRLNKLNFSM